MIFEFIKKIPHGTLGYPHGILDVQVKPEYDIFCHRRVAPAVLFTLCSSETQGR